MAYGRNVVYDARDPAATNVCVCLFEPLYSVIRIQFWFYEFKFLIFFLLHDCRFPFEP